MDDEQQIETVLERLNLGPVRRGRYWHIHCPFHDDSNKSAVCFTDGWICCFAGCPRRNINSISNLHIQPRDVGEAEARVSEAQDWTDLWLSLDVLESSVKGVPASVLNKLGWREFPGGFGVPGGVFIPYFSRDRATVQFFQVRHPQGSQRRFTFAPGGIPTIYGEECITRAKRYLAFTEGSRDSVILRMAGIPAVALPSASSGKLLRDLGREMSSKGTILVAVSDRDEAGEKLLSSIDVPYIDMRTPIGKDVGDFYEEKGLQAVKEYYARFALRQD